MERNKEIRTAPPIDTKVEELPAADFKEKQEILEMTPLQLREYFKELEKSGQLQALLEGFQDDKEMIAQFSYWEKWFRESQRKLIDGIIEKKKEVYPGDKDSLPLELDKKFDESECEVVFSNLAALQLTHGCSKKCPFCAFDAVPGVRDHVSYPELVNLFERYGESFSKNEPILYWASEPSDYDFEDKTYIDVHQLAVQYAGYNPHVTSNEIKNEKWLEFLNSDIVLEPRISAYSKDNVNFASINRQYRNLYIEGVDKKHAKGVGISSTKGKSKTGRGIGCVDGILLTPRGLFNVMNIQNISERTPQSMIVVPFDKFEDRPIKSGEDLTETMRNFVMEYNKNHYYPHDIASNLINLVILIDSKSEERLVFFDNNLKVFKGLKLGELVDERMIEERQKTEEWLSGELDKFETERKEILEEYNDIVKSTHLENFGEFSRRDVSYVGNYSGGLRYKNGELIGRIGNVLYIMEPDDQQIIVNCNYDNVIEMPELFKRIEGYKRKVAGLFKKNKQRVEEIVKRINEGIEKRFEEQIGGFLGEVSLQQITDVIESEKSSIRGKIKTPVFEIKEEEGEAFIIDKKSIATEISAKGSIKMYAAFVLEARLSEEELEEIKKRRPRGIKQDIPFSVIQEVLGDQAKLGFKIDRVNCKDRTRAKRPGWVSE